MKRFNFAAAFGGRLWMAYHFLIIQLLLASIMDVIVYTMIESGFRYYYTDMIRASVYANAVSVIYVCFKFILFGFLGNQFWENRKEKRLYKFIEYFEKHEKSIIFRVAAIFLYIIWLAAGEQMLIQEIVSNILY